MSAAPRPLPPASPGGGRIYLDHAATTPVCDAAREAMGRALAQWANPSSPHREGRQARAELEDARGRIVRALDWDGQVILTGGATEAIAIALGRTTMDRVVVSPVEHEAVLRMTQDSERLAINSLGRVTETVPGALHAIQHVNNETGVIQPIADLAARIHADGGWLFCDCAQSAGKIALPREADLIAISAHKFGGPPGAGALLVRDFALIRPQGGQEQGYRGGTENLPAIVGMAAALEQDGGWVAEAARLRAIVDAGVTAAGGEAVARGAERLATIAGYRLPGMPARAQLVRLDMAGIAVSAGAACSSGSLKASPVLTAMGWDAAAADEVIRVSFGRQTTEADVHAFLDAWSAIARAKAA